MPVISSLVLTNQLPGKTYTASVVTSASMVSGMAGNLLADGLGNQITLLHVTVSYAHTASIQTSWEESSSFASRSMWCTTASFASRSFAATSASWASQSVSASYVTASSVFGGLTRTFWFVSASGATDYVTMSFVNGILTFASP